MASFTLADIHKAADAKYGSTDITLDNGFVVKLLNPLRLPADNRKQLMALQSTMDAENEGGEGVDEQADNQLVNLKQSVRLIADTATGAEKLLESLGDDLALLASLFEAYTEGTQAGEASGSQS